jgi:hypothetical protein
VPNAPSALNSLWVDQIVLLGGIDQVEDCFSLFIDSVNLDTR